MKIYVIESGEHAVVLFAHDDDEAMEMFQAEPGVVEGAGGTRLTSLSAIPDEPEVLFVGKQRPRATAPNPSGGDLA